MSATIPYLSAQFIEDLEIHRLDQYRPVCLHPSREVFSPRLMFNCSPVRGEDLELVLAVALEMIVERLTAYGAPHFIVAIAPPKDDDLPVGVVTSFWLREDEYPLVEHPEDAENGEDRRKLDVLLAAFKA